ncbi:MAG: mevalonate kinase [Desulfurococcales archaeon]|nr:mevalonate kinase [Desulfurococcales archaeon]
MRRVVASAPGKVILFGEHFVVKGCLGIASAINVRVQAEARLTRGEKLRLYSRNLGFRVVLRKDMELEELPEDARPFASILRYLVSQGYNFLGAEIEIRSHLPPGAGLGSSAASAAAFALAYTHLHGDALDKHRLFIASLEAEKIAHGKPSGIDPTISVYGGWIAYRRDKGASRVNARLDAGYRFIVADTGVRRKTGPIVESVLALAEKRWDVLKHVYRAAEEVSEKALRALEIGDYETIADLMNISQGLLNAIGVSSLEIEKLIAIARSSGALGAKLTGAGRGGSIVVLAPSDSSRVTETLKGYSPWVSSVALGDEGSRIDQE